MKNWKLDVRFSSVLSQRGPPSLDKVEKRDDASSWNDDLCTRPVYVGNLRALRNQNITNFTADWKLWHLRFQHTSRGTASKKKKRGNWEASIPHNSSSDERVTSSSSAHMFWSGWISIVETLCSKYQGCLSNRLLCVCLGRQAGWVFGLLTCRRTLRLCSELEKRLQCYKEAFHPVELPSVKFTKPSWLILQSLDDIRFKSTSLLFAQRKQALHTNATSSSLLWLSCMGWDEEEEQVLFSVGWTRLKQLILLGT